PGHDARMRSTERPDLLLGSIRPLELTLVLKPSNIDRDGTGESLVNAIIPHRLELQTVIRASMTLEASSGSQVPDWLLPAPLLLFSALLYMYEVASRLCLHSQPDIASAIWSGMLWKPSADSAALTSLSRPVAELIKVPTALVARADWLSIPSA